MSESASFGEEDSWRDAWFCANKDRLISQLSEGRGPKFSPNLEGIDSALANVLDVYDDEVERLNTVRIAELQHMDAVWESVFTSSTSKYEGPPSVLHELTALLASPTADGDVESRQGAGAIAVNDTTSTSPRDMRATLEAFPFASEKPSTSLSKTATSSNQLSSSPRPDQGERVLSTMSPEQRL